VRPLSSLLQKLTPARAGLRATSSAEHQPTSGLVVIQVTPDCPKAEPALFRLYLDAAAAPAFEKPIDPAAAQGFWIALHGQLLPNGPARIRLELTDRRGVLARHDMTLQVRNEGAVAEQVRASLKANGAPLVLDGVCDSGDYDYADPALTAWFDREPAVVEAHLEHLTASGAATADEIEALRHFVDHGYLVVSNVIDADHLRRLNAAVDDAVERKLEGYEWGSSQRLHNLHQQYPAVQELWLHPTIMRLLSLIFDSPARPCQSLTYVFGSQQEHHQDTIHLTPFPAGRMCGVWTALEDVQPDSGELVVFPGSHRLPRIYMRSVGLPKVRNDDWSAFQEKVVAHWTDLINGRGLAPSPYRPKAGSVLIWHENLMHAGSLRKDLSKSRRSIVGHYFAHGAVVYYDSSGLPGALHEGGPP
jgi:ectoine hydroxylase-related dioxygenase (phytanoyl-CoA dioxygenase family)